LKKHHAPVAVGLMLFTTASTARSLFSAVVIVAVTTEFLKQNWKA